MKLRGKLKQKRRKEQQAARWARRPKSPIFQDYNNDFDLAAAMAAVLMTRKAREAQGE